jgi:hypothetical protein
MISLASLWRMPRLPIRVADFEATELSSAQGSTRFLSGMEGNQNDKNKVVAQFYVRPIDQKNKYVYILQAVVSTNQPPFRSTTSLPKLSPSHQQLSRELPKKLPAFLT